MTDPVLPLGEPKYFITEIVRHGGVMRIRCAPDNGGDEVELASLDILESLPPLENAPVADLQVTLAPEAGIVPSDVAVRDRSSGVIASETWDWGDGSDPEVFEISAEDLVFPLGVTRPHTYAEAGTYTLTVTVDGPGGEDVATHDFVVTDA